MSRTGKLGPGLRAAALTAAGAALLAAGPAVAELPIESIGKVETLQLPYSPHWIWVGDVIQRRSALIDVNDGRMLGIVDSGWGVPQTLHPKSRPEVYAVETHYSRGSRGERSDVLTVYDAASLAPLAEVALPPKRGFSAVPVAHAALSDDDRFAAVLNMNPATSLSIVDLERRSFVGEIATPGCSLVYPVGARRFASLCMDGAMLVLTLDDAGREASRLRTEPFFDPESDPVTEKAARWGDHWFFPSFEGRVYSVSFKGEEPVFGEPWSLVPDDDRDEGWRIGGAQHLAVHRASGRLYALMHRGGPDTHKQAGTEVWVYHLATFRRIQRIELESPGFTYLGVPIEGGPTWGWLVDWLGNRLMGAVPELGIDSIVVTQDDAPRLATSGMFSGGVASYDALTGEFLGRVFTGNMTNVVLVAPAPGASR